MLLSLDTPLESGCSTSIEDSTLDRCLECRCAFEYIRSFDLFIHLIGLIDSSDIEIWFLHLTNHHCFLVWRCSFDWVMCCGCFNLNHSIGIIVNFVFFPMTNTSKSKFGLRRSHFLDRLIRTRIGISIIIIIIHLFSSVTLTLWLIRYPHSHSHFNPTMYWATAEYY